MPKERDDLLYGTLDMIVLRVLALEPMHGWGIALRIEEMSGKVFEVNQGSLYPALQKMKRRGWVRSEWRRTENNRRARYYRLTPAGERQLEQHVDDWNRTSGAVNGILRWADGLA